MLAPESGSICDREKQVKKHDKQVRSVMRDDGAELMRALLVLRAGRGSKHHFASPQAQDEIAFLFLFCMIKTNKRLGEMKKKNQCERENNRKLFQIQRNNILRCH